MNTFTAHQPKPQNHPKKEFVNYIHNFRGLAIIFVVAGHLLLDWPEGSASHTFFRVFWENGTVLFIFIAGYLFQHLSAKFEFGNYLKKKVQNVIIPYFVVSAPIIVYRLLTADIPGYVLAVNPDFHEWTWGSKLSYFITRGAHLQPLWFIPMITLFYIAAPALIYIDRHPRLYWLLLIFVPLSIWVVREPFTDIPKMFVHFTSVYIFGMFMSRFKKRYLEVASRLWLPITIITLASIVVNFIWFEEINNRFNYVQKMLLCACSIYWLWKLDKFIPKGLAILAEVSFGIFFLHYYAILIVKAGYTKVFGTEIPGNLLYWFIDFIVVMAGTVLVIFAIQKLAGKRSRRLIGC